MVTRGFSAVWIRLIKSVLINSSFTFRINNCNGNYFVAGKGLKQGDPLSPIMFKLVVDVF
jgi:hypothetical protein